MVNTELKEKVWGEEVKGRERGEENQGEKWSEGQCYLPPLSLFFAGDTILEVNGESVKFPPVEKVVETITRVSYHLSWFLRGEFVCTSIIACKPILLIIRYDTTLLTIMQAIKLSTKTIIMKNWHTIYGHTINNCGLQNNNV